MNFFDTVIVQPIFNLLMVIYGLIPGGDFGVSLVIFTLIIRILLWPLIKKQLHQAKKMRSIQPEMKKLREKVKDNKRLAGLATLELYKKNGISPFRTILILLIQLPIFLGIFRVVQIFTVDHTQLGAEISKWSYNFVHNMSAVKPVIENPDNFNTSLFNIVDLTSHAISPNGISWAIVAMVIISSYLQFIMSKQTATQTTDRRIRDILAEAAQGTEPDQAEINAAVMQKMIKIMPIMVAVIMLNLPAALVLYYFVTNVVGVLQQKYILSKGDEEIIPLDKTDFEEVEKKVAQLDAARQMYGSIDSRLKDQDSNKSKNKESKKSTDSQPEVVRIRAKSTAKKRK